MRISRSRGAIGLGAPLWVLAAYRFTQPGSKQTSPDRPLSAKRVRKVKGTEVGPAIPMSVLPDTQQPADGPVRASRLRRAPVDVVERRHDISRTVDPGHRPGARYERAARHRSRRRAFRQRCRALADK